MLQNTHSMLLLMTQCQECPCQDRPLIRAPCGCDMDEYKGRVWQMLCQLCSYVWSKYALNSTNLLLVLHKLAGLPDWQLQHKPIPLAVLLRTSASSWNHIVNRNTSVLTYFGSGEAWALLYYEGSGGGVCACVPVAELQLWFPRGFSPHLLSAVRVLLWWGCSIPHK